MPHTPERANPLMPPDADNANPQGTTTGSAWRHAITQLRDRVQAWTQQEQGLLRASVPAPACDPLAWLAANPLAPRFYWQDRDGRVTLAGLGSAWQLEAEGPEAYRSLLEQGQALARQADVRLLCGFSFDGQRGEAEWTGFPAGMALLPAVALEADSQGRRLSVHLLADSAETLQQRRAVLLDLLDGLQPAETARMTGTARITSRRETPSHAEHQARIANLLADIEQDRLHKAVPARRVALSLDRPLPALATLQRWSALTGDSYTFAIEQGDRLFMGCSPERLFRRNGRQVETESLAGTVRRGASAEEDAALASALRHDPKLIREHGWVTRYIRSELEPWTTAVEAPHEARILKLDRIQHRQLPIRATLRPAVGDNELIRALHPTPAVCGFPRHPAQERITRDEGFQRGWYSGVMGVLAGDSAEMAVAIRSALVAAERAWCYSGVGVVRGSEPEAEWQELEAKIETFLAAVQG
ncbi:MAG: isochorismate synthase [Halorhodospira sp.]